MVPFCIINIMVNNRQRTKKRRTVEKCTMKKKLDWYKDFDSLSTAMGRST